MTTSYTPTAIKAMNVNDRFETLADLKVYINTQYDLASDSQNDIVSLHLKGEIAYFNGQEAGYKTVLPYVYSEGEGYCYLLTITYTRVYGFTHTENWYIGCVSDAAYINSQLGISANAPDGDDDLYDVDYDGDYSEDEYSDDDSAVEYDIDSYHTAIYNQLRKVRDRMPNHKDTTVKVSLWADGRMLCTDKDDRLTGAIAVKQLEIDPDYADGMLYTLATLVIYKWRSAGITIN